MRSFLIVVMISLFLTMLSAPTPASVKSENSGTETQQREQYKKSMEERFRKLGKELDELKAKAETMSKQAHKEMHRSLADAEKKREEVSRRLEAMQAEGRKRWDRFVKDVNAAMEEFEKAFERAQSHFKNDRGSREADR